MNPLFPFYLYPWEGPADPTQGVPHRSQSTRLYTMWFVCGDTRSTVEPPNLIIVVWPILFLFTLIRR